MVQDFLIHTKLYRILQNRRCGDGPYYLKSTINYIKHLVTKMEADQPITCRTISTDPLYASIGSTNWLLDCGIATVGTLQKGRTGIPSDLFDAQIREAFSGTCHFEMEKNKVFLTSYTIKTKPKGKEKPQIIKFYDFIKSGADILVQLNEY